MNFLELVKARYSSRNYDARPVEQEKLDYIMECVWHRLQSISNRGVSAL